VRAACRRIVFYRASHFDCFSAGAGSLGTQVSACGPVEQAASNRYQDKRKEYPAGPLVRGCADVKNASSFGGLMPNAWPTCAC
jgi:hypothetical protein